MKHVDDTLDECFKHIKKEKDNIDRGRRYGISFFE